MNDIRNKIMEILVGYDKRYSVASLSILIDRIMEVIRTPDSVECKCKCHKEGFNPFSIPHKVENCLCQPDKELSKKPTKLEGSRVELSKEYKVPPQIDSKEYAESTYSQNKAYAENIAPQTDKTTWDERFDKNIAQYIMSERQAVKSFIAEELKKARVEGWKNREEYGSTTATMHREIDLRNEALDAYRGKLIKTISKWTGGGSQSDGYDQAIDEVLTLIKEEKNETV